MRLLIAALTLGLASTAAPFDAGAQTWPEKPIHIIVAFTPGSATDIIARSVSNELSARLGQTVIVENRPGAGGTIAAAQVAKAAPDGYTLLVNSSGHTVNPWIYPSLPYDTAKDLKGVSIMARQPNVLVVSPTRGWVTVGDLVKAAKAAPGKMSFASAGVGSATHMNGEKFKVAAGIDVLHVPYKGTPEALNDVMGGRVDYFFSPVVSALSIVNDKRLQALAVGSPARASVLPDVPTTEEAGYKGSAYNYWAGLFAPAGTPPRVIERLNKELVAALALPEVKERLAKIGADPAPTSPAEFDALVVRELAENGELVKAAGIKGAVMANEPLLQTTVVGSYPQPDWLVNRAMLNKIVPRTRYKELWRVEEAYLEQAQDDATLLAIRDMERAGIDIVTDGEIRRESYSNRFATALEGVDDEHPFELVNRGGNRTPVPRVVGRIRRTRPVELRDMQFLRANTGKLAKITLPGPFTMGQQVKNEFYKDNEEMCMDYAAAVNAEALDLVKAGADVIQLDEPWLRNNPEEAGRYAVKAINRALQGITVPTVVHLCFGYAAVVTGLKPTGYSFLPQLSDTIAQQISIESAQPKIDLGVLKDLAPKKVMLGVIDLSDPEIETPQKIAERIRAGLKYLSPDKLLPAPDCGMKYLPRATAFGKLKALAEGAAIVRKEL